MRGKNQLIQMLIDHIENDNVFTGMCISLYELNILNKIEDEEFEFLRKYIETNKPEEIKFRGYWWTEGVKEPRIEFLNELINKTIN